LITFSSSSFPTDISGLTSSLERTKLLESISPSRFGCNATFKIVVGVDVKILVRSSGTKPVVWSKRKKRAQLQTAIPYSDLMVPGVFRAWYVEKWLLFLCFQDDGNRKDQLKTISTACSPLMPAWWWRFYWTWELTNHPMIWLDFRFRLP
jgi:hypothetical protein